MEFERRFHGSLSAITVDFERHPETRTCGLDGDDDRVPGQAPALERAARRNAPGDAPNRFRNTRLNDDSES